jgi:AcrR family transcriptional regulator
MTPLDAERSSQHDLIWMRPERPQRTQPTGLNREQIVHAAIELADAEGELAVSMRRIAAKLGVGTMSLYWYLSSKQDLFDLVLDALFGEIALPTLPSGDWRADLHLLASQMRSLLLRHPWLSALLNSHPPLGPHGLRYAEFCFAALERCGVDSATMISVVETLNGYVMGFVQSKIAEMAARQHRRLTEQGWRKAIAPYIRKVAMTGQYPTVARLLLEENTLNNEETGFAFGLDCVLDGIALHMTTGHASNNG